MVTPPPAEEVFANADPFARDHDNVERSSQGGHGVEDAVSVAGPDDLPPDGRPTDGLPTVASVQWVKPNHKESQPRPQPAFDIRDRDISDASRDRTDGPNLEFTTVAMDKMRSAAKKFKLESIKTSGFSRLFNPTAVRMRFKYEPDGEEASDANSQQEFALLWRARDNRKGRNSIAVPVRPMTTDEESMTAPMATLAAIAKNIWKMLVTFPYWDMAFWSGWGYTIGSVLFVIDGAFSWGPQRFPGSEFPGEAKYGVPLCFFFGALFYQIGAVMAYLEAVNDGSFHGSAMRRLLEGHEEDHKKMLDDKIHAFFGRLLPHPHKDKEVEEAEALARTVDPEAGWKTRDLQNQRPGSIYPPDTGPAPRRGGVDLGGEEGDSSTYITWRWWPTWHALRTHHIYEIGYLACSIQLLGVTLYGVTGVVVLPGILDSLNVWQTNVAYWIPEIVAAACFLTASIMFTLEAQDKWWLPAPRQLGWWIGAWSIVGSVGFELSAGFGPTSQNSSWAEYQSSLSSMWGSAAYLIGSFLQWYEALDKNPVMRLDESDRKGDRTFPVG